LVGKKSFRYQGVGDDLRITGRNRDLHGICVWGAAPPEFAVRRIIRYTFELLLSITAVASESETFRMTSSITSKKTIQAPTIARGETKPVSGPTTPGVSGTSPPPKRGASSFETAPRVQPRPERYVPIPSSGEDLYDIPKTQISIPEQVRELLKERADCQRIMREYGPGSGDAGDVARRSAAKRFHEINASFPNATQISTRISELRDSLERLADFNRSVSAGGDAVVPNLKQISEEIRQLEQLENLALLRSELSQHDLDVNPTNEKARSLRGQIEDAERKFLAGV
jgi:hypothetical protein